jgi:hypothetical protein
MSALVGGSAFRATVPINTAQFIKKIPWAVGGVRFMQKIFECLALEIFQLSIVG